MRADIQIYNSDCMPAMAKMADKQFDLVIVDPPYGIGAGKGTEIYLKKTDKWNTGRTKNEKTIYGDWDSSIPKSEYFKEIRRVSKNRIIWGGNYFMNNMATETGVIVWDKKNGDSFFADGEIAIHSFNNKLRIFRYLSCGFMGSHKNRATRIHPTQKPVQLYKWLLQNYAKDGDKILDTHLGSGSIAIACWDLGFNLTGYEIDKEYYDNAVLRLERHQAQGQLF